MRHYKLFLSLGLLALILSCAGGVLILLLRHERSFYSRLSPPPGAQRERESKDCVRKLVGVTGNIMDHNTDGWEARFTEKELNSYFAEDFEASGISEQMLPDDVSAPRISLEEDGIVRLGFRYGKRPWKTLITVDFRVWLAKDEINAVCMELLSVHAGGLPISAQGMLEKVFDVARRQNVDVTWYSHNGHQTAVLRFQPGQSHPSVELKTLQIQNGEILIGGQSAEPSTLRAWLFPRERVVQEVTD